MTSFLMPDPSPEQWLDSYNNPANAEAMRELDGSEIEITEQDGAHIIAKVTPEGRALLDRLPLRAIAGQQEIARQIQRSRKALRKLSTLRSKDCYFFDSYYLSKFTNPFSISQSNYP
jgi:hypothetical protein